MMVIIITLVALLIYSNQLWYISFKSYRRRIDKLIKEEAQRALMDYLKSHDISDLLK
jgi:hypothetical protein